MKKKVADYWDCITGCKWDEFAHNLSATILVKIASVVLSSDETEQDGFAWAEGKGRFTVKTAYRLSKNWRTDESWAGWHRIWGLQVQHRVRVFVWLMAHERLLSNVERRRHVGGSGMCDRCQEEEETVMHAVRDCRVARTVWERVVPKMLMPEFYSLGMKDWLMWVLNGSHSGGESARCAEVIAIICWLQWRWRNGEIFRDENLSTQEKFRQMLGYVEEGQRAFSREEMPDGRGMEEVNG